MEGDNTVLSAHTNSDTNERNEVVSQHVSQGGLQTAGEPETAVAQSLKSPQQKVASVFSTSSLADTSQSLGNLATYNEVLSKLNGLFEEQQREIQALTDNHWKSQEFPLARIKKIMRMDDDVKMISAEVPIMFSKAVEMFITELSLRAWLHTDEAKKRTLQRGDIAMAITKHDMFDFLIDIVPREEIQLKTRSKPDGEQVQVVSPELLQVLLQQLAQQQASSAHGSAEGEQDVGVSPPADVASNGLLQQQIQLIQQLVQLQMLQQEQQQQMDQEPMLDLQQRAESQAGGGGEGGTLDHTYSVLQNMATSEHLTQPGSHQNITGQQISHPQSISPLSGGQQMLHHVSDGTAIDMQDAVMGGRSQPISIVVQSPPPLLDQGARSQYQGLPHLHHHHHIHHHPSVVVQVIDGNSSEGIEFQNIPESESISRSISPITGALHTDQDIAYSSQSLLSRGTNSSLQNVPRTS
eukprot:Em0022g251a